MTVGLCSLISMTMANVALSAPYKIMAIGDSLTHGINAFPLPNAPYGYRVPLYNKLTTTYGFDLQMVGSQSQTDSNGTSSGGTLYNDGTNSLNQFHEGHSSWRIGGTYDLNNVDGSSSLNTPSNVVSQGVGLVSFKVTEGTIPDNFAPTQPDGGQSTARGIFEHLPTMLNANPPGQNPNDVDTVIMWIGINDIKNGEDPTSAPARLTALIDRAVGLLPSTSNLIVMNLANVGSDYNLGLFASNAAGLNSAIATFNSDILTNINAKNYSNVTLFDTNALIEQYVANNPTISPYFSDDLHFADDAYGFIGETLADQIAFATIPEPSVLALLVISATLLSSRSRHAAA